VDWKPKIQYYDYVAQSTDKKPVKQVFPYVKVSFVSCSLHIIVILSMFGVIC
jgi:hypothetical protein